MLSTSYCCALSADKMKPFFCLMFHDHVLCFNNQCAAGDVVPSTREIRISGSEFKFFLSSFG